MGADRSPDAEGVWFFLLRTSSPVISPHVYAAAMTTSRAMTTPAAPPEFRVSKATSHVPIYTQTPKDNVVLTSTSVC